MSSRGWCFTIIYTTDDGRQARDPLFSDLPDKARFVIWQKEEGGNTHRLHYQGYIKFKETVRANKLKEILGADWAHVEIQKASDAAAANYCLKEDTKVDGPWKLGQDISQGKRSDLIEVAAMVKEKRSLSEIAEEYPVEWIKFNRGIISLANKTSNSSMRLNLEVIVLWGETGTGKTYWCYRNYPDLYRVNCRDKQPVWWDGYEGQKTVLFDDFEGQCNRLELLNYLDIYPIKGPVKGSFVDLNYIRVLITSNVDPMEWYQWINQRQLDALKRRLKSIYFINTDSDLPPDRIDRHLENQ